MTGLPGIELNLLGIGSYNKSLYLLYGVPMELFLKNSAINLDC